MIHYINIEMKRYEIMACDILNSYIEQALKELAAPFLFVATDKTYGRLEIHIDKIPSYQQEGYIVANHAELDDAMILINAEHNLVVAKLPRTIMNSEYQLFESVRWHIATYIQIILEKNYKYMLHASVVDVNGLFVFLFGDSRSGKTTNLLRFISKGYKLISDDKVVVSSCNNIIRIIPVYPNSVQIRDGECSRIASKMSIKGLNIIPFEGSRRYMLENKIADCLETTSVVCCFLSNQEDGNIKILRPLDAAGYIAKSTIIMNDDVPTKFKFIHMCKCIANSGISVLFNGLMTNDNIVENVIKLATT